MKQKGGVIIEMVISVAVLLTITVGIIDISGFLNEKTLLTDAVSAIGRITNIYDNIEASDADGTILQECDLSEEAIVTSSLSINNFRNEVCRLTQDWFKKSTLNPNDYNVIIQPLLITYESSGNQDSYLYLALQRKHPQKLLYMNSVSMKNCSSIMVKINVDDVNALDKNGQAFLIQAEGYQAVC